MKTATIILSALLLGSVLVACGGGGQDPGGSAENFLSGGTFTTSITSDPGNLDPLQVTSNTTALVTSFAYDSLISLNDKGEPVSQLASTWDVTPTSVTFTLREDVTCADGSKLTASQVAANFEYVRNAANQSSAIGTDLPDTDFTVTANDAARTVTINRTTPYGFLLPGAGGMPIVCAKGTADRKLLANSSDGTGPFTLVEAVPGDHYTFDVRKDYHWGPNGASTDVPGFPAKVVVKVVQNPSTAVNLLLSGQLTDVAVVGAERQRVAGKGFHEVTQPGSLVEVFFNQREGHPGAHLEVRRALISAVNREQLRKVLSEDDADNSEPTSLVHNEPKACRNDTVRGNLPNHDESAARSALDKAGWSGIRDGIRAKDGKPLQVKVMYPAGTPSLDAGMELLGGWWKQLGAEVELKPTDGNAMNQELFGNPASWDVAVMAIGVSLPSQLVGFLSGPEPPEGQNFPAINNPEYDRLVERAGQTTGQAGCDLWAEAEKALFQRFDVIPMSAGVVHSYLNKARYTIGDAGPEPTSIRLLAG